MTPEAIKETEKHTFKMHKQEKRVFYNEIKTISSTGKKITASVVKMVISNLYKA